MLLQYPYIIHYQLYLHTFRLPMSPYAYQQRSFDVEWPLRQDGFPHHLRLREHKDISGSAVDGFFFVCLVLTGGKRAIFRQKYPGNKKGNTYWAEKWNTCSCGMREDKRSFSLLTHTIDSEAGAFPPDINHSIIPSPLPGIPRTRHTQLEFITVMLTLELLDVFIPVSTCMPVLIFSTKITLYFREIRLCRWQN